MKVSYSKLNNSFIDPWTIDHLKEELENSYTFLIKELNIDDTTFGKNLTIELSNIKGVVIPRFLDVIYSYIIDNKVKFNSFTLYMELNDDMSHLSIKLTSECDDETVEDRLNINIQKIKNETNKHDYGYFTNNSIRDSLNLYVSDRFDYTGNVLISYLVINNGTELSDYLKEIEGVLNSLKFNASDIVEFLNKFKQYINAKTTCVEDYVLNLNVYRVDHHKVIKLYLFRLDTYSKPYGSSPWFINTVSLIYRDSISFKTDKYIVTSSKY